MQYKSLELVTAGDLRALVGVAPERKRREYKEALPSGKSDDHKEFVNDVSSFANAEGGDLLFGIREDRETHTAGEVVGIPTADVESNIARLENLVRDGIRPRLPHFAMHTVDVGDGKTVLVLRIGESHLAPHQNTMNHRFYARNTNGKYIMEVGELRDMILRRESLPDRIRSFRRARVELIQQHPEDMPIAVQAEKKLVVHFIPLETFGRFDSAKVAQLNTPALRNVVTQTFPLRHADLGLSYRPNIDGYVFMNGRGESKFPFYVQVFNDGCVEFVDSTAFYNLAKDPIFGPAPVEGNLFQSYVFVAGIFNALQIGGPVYVFMTALGIRECAMVLPDEFLPRTLSLVGHNEKMGRDPALFNEVIVDDMHESPQTALYEVVAQLWRAAAFPRPLSYTEDARYVGVRGG